MKKSLPGHGLQREDEAFEDEDLNVEFYRRNHMEGEDISNQFLSGI